jgi:hypothetical protein
MFLWSHVPDVVQALDRPATSRKAQRYRTAVVCFFLIAALSLLSAAIVFVINEPIFVSNVLGWSGIVFLHISIACGLRYKAINSRFDVNPPAPTPDTPSESNWPAPR